MKSHVFWKKTTVCPSKLILYDDVNSNMIASIEICNISYPTKYMIYDYYNLILSQSPICYLKKDAQQFITCIFKLELATRLQTLQNESLLRIEFIEAKNFDFSNYNLKKGNGTNATNTINNKSSIIGSPNESVSFKLNFNNMLIKIANLRLVSPRESTKGELNSSISSSLLSDTSSGSGSSSGSSSGNGNSSGNNGES